MMEMVDAVAVGSAEKDRSRRQLEDKNIPSDYRLNLPTGWGIRNQEEEEEGGGDGGGLPPSRGPKRSNRPSSRPQLSNSLCSALAQLFLGIVPSGSPFDRLRFPPVQKDLNEKTNGGGEEIRRRRTREPRLVRVFE